HVFQLNACLPAREQRHLANFMARREAIAPKQRNESGARLRRYGKTGFAHLLVDETNQIFCRVWVARQHRGVLGALANGAQRRVALEVAGLDHDAAIRRRRCNEGFKRGSKVARASFYPDRATTAEQRNRVGLLEEARGLAAEIVAVEARELKRILRIVNRFPYERFRALVHQARVRAENEHDRPIRPGKEVLDLGGFQRDHEISRSPASGRDSRSKKGFAPANRGELGRLREDAIVGSALTSQR